MQGPVALVGPAQVLAVRDAQVPEPAAQAGPVRVPVALEPLMRVQLEWDVQARVSAASVRPGAGVGGVGRPGATPAGGIGSEGVAAGAVATSPAAGSGAYAAGATSATAAAGTHYASADALAAQSTAFRSGAAGYPNYNAAAFAAHPGAWQPTHVVSTSLYTHPGYAALARGLGLAAVAGAYDYGGNVVVQSGSVYVNGDPAGSTQEYADEASNIASAGQADAPAADAKWLPLGVFAIVEEGQTASDDIFQLAVDPQGILRGNYHNTKTDDMEPISGSVDKQSQRTAWTIGTDKTPVYEAGIANLTKDITPVLVLNADGSTHQMNLIRMPEPADQPQPQ